MKKALRKLLKKVFSKERVRVLKDHYGFPDSHNIKIGKDFAIGNFRSIIIEPNATILIEENVIIREFVNILAYNNSCLIIHKNVFCNNYLSINCLGKITIGENTLLGEGVKIYDHNHKYTFANDTLTVERNDFEIKEVSIGKNCWLGSNVTILKGVVIGDNVIVGANNLIYKSIPANTIVKSKAELSLNNFEESI